MKTRQTLAFAVSLAAVAAAAACAKHPTAGKAKAAVGAAKQEAEAPTAGEKLAITAQHGTIGFVGAKVSAQHVGWFHDFAGTVALVDGDATKSRVDFTVQTASLTIEGGPDDLE